MDFLRAPFNDIAKAIQKKIFCRHQIMSVSGNDKLFLSLLLQQHQFPNSSSNNSSKIYFPISLMLCNRPKKNHLVSSPVFFSIVRVRACVFVCLCMCVRACMCVCVCVCVSGIGCWECDAVSREKHLSRKGLQWTGTFKAQCSKPFRLTFRPLSIFIAGFVLAHFSSRMG